jgi:hypothetical protein
MSAFQPEPCPSRRHPSHPRLDIDGDYFVIEDAGGVEDECVSVVVDGCGSDFFGAPKFPKTPFLGNKESTVQSRNVRIAAIRTQLLHQRVLLSVRLS